MNTLEQYIEDTRMALERAVEKQKEYNELYAKNGNEAFKRLAEYYDGMSFAHSEALLRLESLKTQKG